MSRIGKKPIPIPPGVEVKVDGNSIKVKGTKGELIQEIHPLVKIGVVDNLVKIEVSNPKIKKQKALWGLFGSLVKNMIEGVTKGFEKKLEIIGIGFKAAVSGNKLTLNLGFTHQIEFDIPKGIIIIVEKNILTISGFDKQLVGETAARIRALKKPEPYKGKGIKYIDEVVRRKAGKAIKGATEGA